jgi:hypothetical protein
MPFKRREIPRQPPSGGQSAANGARLRRAHERREAQGGRVCRNGRFWKQTLAAENSTYTNDRREGWEYDASGNLVAGDSSESTFDAAGRQTYSHAPAGGECGGLAYEITQQYDGDGRPAKRAQTRRFSNGGEPPVCTTTQEETYYIYSAALGGAKLAELDVNGAKAKGYVYGGGGLLAKQEIYQNTNSSAVKWQHRNPGSASWVETASNRVFERQEMDPLGQETGTFDPFLIIPNPNYGDVHGDTPMFVDGGDPFHLSDGCGDIDGLPASCSEIRDRMANGTAVNDTFGTITTVRITDANGSRTYSGFAGLPPGENARFTGFAAGIAASAFHLYSDNGFGTAVFMSVLWGGLASGRGVEANASHFAPQDAGVRGELTGRRLQEYTDAKNRVLDRLKNSDSCKSFLLEKLGLSAGAVSSAVNRQRAFDGLTTTITAADAGLVPHIDPRTNQPHSLANKAVKDLFTGKGRPDAMQAGFASNEDRGASQRDIYYGWDFDSSTVLHETLHSFTGLDDASLMEKLEGNISTELTNHGCT